MEELFFSISENINTTLNNFFNFEIRTPNNFFNVKIPVLNKNFKPSQKKKKKIWYN